MTLDDVSSIALGLLVATLVVGLGALALHAVRRRALAASITILTVVPLVAILTGVLVTSQFMFTDEIRRIAIVWVAVTIVAVPSAVLLGRSLARQSVWEREAIERERAAERSRRELLAWLSHDLRTPITSVRAMSEALEDGVVHRPDEVRQYAQIIGRETTRLAGMIEDLFAMSQISAGVLQLEAAPLAVDDLVVSAAEAARPLAEQRGVELTVDRGPGAVSGSLVALGSSPELLRVLDNLVVNAIRHTPAGQTVRLVVGLSAHDVVVHVEDGCGGIPEADLARVFDLGYRGSDARESDPDAGPQGAGLGLAIARGLLDAQKGSVTVRNRAPVGEAVPGCRFEVRLPRP